MWVRDSQKESRAEPRAAKQLGKMRQMEKGNHRKVRVADEGLKDDYSDYTQGDERTLTIHTTRRGC